MEYKIRSIDDEFMKEKGLSKARLEREMCILKSVIRATPFQCSGVVVAGETRHKWRYCHSFWPGDDLYILRTVYLKKPDTTAHVIAILEEDTDADKYVRDDGRTGNEGNRGASLLGQRKSGDKDNYSGVD